MHVGAEHGVPETARLTLPCVVDLGEFGSFHDGGQPVVVVLRREGPLEHWRAVEVILQGGLVAPGDDQHLIAGRLVLAQQIARLLIFGCAATVLTGSFTVIVGVLP